MVLAIAQAAQATTVDERSLSDLVCEADHALVATVVNVDMVDAEGRPIMSRRAGTGPHASSRIRLHLLVHSALFSAAADLPQRIVLALWPEWHHDLGAVQDGSLGRAGIFLLKGGHFAWVYPADFWRDIDEIGAIVMLRRGCGSEPSGRASASQQDLTRSAPHAVPAHP